MTPNLASLGHDNYKTLIPKPSQILTVFTKGGNPVHITLDGGATGSFITLECATRNGFKIWKNNQSASLADDETKLNCIGYVEETLYRDKWSVVFKGLVVTKLKAEIYGGQPFMIDNDISLRPAKQTITVNGKYTVMQTNKAVSSTMPKSAALVTLAKLNVEPSVIFPGQSLTIPVPDHINTKHVSVEPRMENLNDNWPVPQILENCEGNIHIPNDTNEPIILRKDVHLMSITECDTIPVEDIEPSISYLHPEDKPMVNNVQSVVTLNDHVKSLKDLTSDQKVKLTKTNEKFCNVFDGKLTGYNNAYGKHVVSLQWADDTRPKTARVHTPRWSSSKDKLLQEKIDQLTEMGVLADPYEHDIQIKCVHPCFLQKKARAGSKSMEQCTIDEVRFLTAANAVNDKLRQVQTKVPDQNEIFRFIANNPFVIYADLYESFFQNHLNKKDWGYMAINSPYKGLRVYTRSTQGLLNQDEELNQLLSKVLGDAIMNGYCMKIADDLIIGGKSIDEAIDNWSNVLNLLSNANLKLSPAKVRFFPEETTIFGWCVKNGEIIPDPHRKLALEKAKYADIRNVSDLRSWMGTYKTFLIALPGLAEIMDPFDRFVAGLTDQKAEIIWTDDLIKAFQYATQQIQHSTRYLTLPRKEEQLIIMTDATVKNPAIGFTLNVMRNEKMLPVLFYSFKLTDHQKNWFPCERECLALATAIKKCAHYILEAETPTLVLTDSKPVKEAASLVKQGKFSGSPRMSAFLTSISRFKVDIQHVSGKFNNNVAADYLSRNPASCTNNSCQLCKFISESSIIDCSAMTDNDSQIPMGSIHSWKKLQQEDYACSEAYKRLKSGQQPAKKGQNSNDIRRYYNACQAKNLLIVEETIPNSTQMKHRIVVPKNMVSAVVTKMHHEDNKHLSEYQLEKVFNRYFFGIHVKKAIQETLQSCLLCEANKKIPKSLNLFESKSNPQHPGVIFNADVIQRNQQRIMVCTDIFSTFTSACLIENEQAECVLKGLIELITPIRSEGEILIRTDSAPAFRSLANSESLKKLKIKLEPTDPSNKNSIATVDNAIKQLETEIAKVAPQTQTINQTILAMALKNLNSIVRNRGYSAHEILFARENKTNENLNFKDEELSDAQQSIKRRNNENKNKDSNKSNTTFEPGQLISVANEKNKHSVRDVYVVNKTFDEKLQVNKIIRFHTKNPRIQTNPRIVHRKDVFKVGTDIQKQKEKHTVTTKRPSAQEDTHEKWQAFPNYSQIDDDSDIEEGKTRNEDPYQELRRWEIQQRQHAKRSLQYAICSPTRTTEQLIDEVFVSERPIRQSTSTQDEWDPQYDIQNPPYDSDDDIDIDDIISKSPLGPMSRVQDIDKLYEEHGLNIDTTKCQNLEAVLMKPTSTSKRKRVSPPRKDLPCEREKRQRITRSAKKGSNSKAKKTNSPTRQRKSSRLNPGAETEREEEGCAISHD